MGTVQARVPHERKDEVLGGAWGETLRAALAAPADAAAPAWLRELKAAAARELLKAGLPGNKDEAWKYTPLRALQELAPRLAGAMERAGPLSAPTEGPHLAVQGPAFGFRWSAGRVHRLGGDVPGGVMIARVDELLRESDGELPTRIRGLLEVLDVTGRNRAVSAMNTAFLEAGMVIRVGGGVDAGTCRFEWDQEDASASLLHHFRLVVLLEEGSRLHLLEHFRDGPPGRPSEAGTGQAFNLVLQADVAAAAEFRHTRIQHTGKQHVLLTGTDLHQAAGSRYAFAGFDVGGALVRHEANCRLDGPGAQADLAGAFVVDGTRHVDHHLCVDHAVAACSSEQFFRGVLGGHGRGVFNGKAVIRKGADGSRVRQSSANLLLSDLAEIDTKPELEIYADEVEARHGATVGQLDEQAVFYLRSRGLSDVAARGMLVSAFCRTVSARLPDKELAAAIDAMLDEAISGIATPAASPGGEST